MPTKAQLDELTANTTYEWTTINGVNGGKFTATNGSGNYIFIPAAGYAYDGSLSDVGDLGAIWSSSINTPSQDSYILSFGEWGTYVDYEGSLPHGYSVRGVLG